MRLLLIAALPLLLTVASIALTLIPDTIGNFEFSHIGEAMQFKPHAPKALAAAFWDPIVNVIRYGDRCHRYYCQYLHDSRLEKLCLKKNAGMRPVQHVIHRDANQIGRDY